MIESKSMKVAKTRLKGRMSQRQSKAVQIVVSRTVPRTNSVELGL